MERMVSLFIDKYPFNKYLLRGYHVSGTVLNTGHKAINMTGVISALLKPEERDDRQINK